MNAIPQKGFIAFICQTSMLATAWQRPGNTEACSNYTGFMR